MFQLLPARVRTFLTFFFVLFNTVLFTPIIFLFALEKFIFGFRSGAKFVNILIMTITMFSVKLFILLSHYEIKMNKNFAIGKI